MNFLYSALIPVISGLVTGTFVGAVAQRTSFCSTGAIADILLANDWRRARSWIMAAAIAVIGAHAGGALGFVPFGNVYATPLANPVLAIPGGLAFGYGMAVAGGCLQRALVRIGGGSLRSLAVVAVMALVGIATIHLMNTTNIWRATSWPVQISSTVYEIHLAVFGRQAGTPTLITAGVVAVAMLVFCLKDKWFVRSPEHMLGGIAIGLAVTFAWLNWDRIGRKYPNGLNLFIDLFRTFDQFLPLANHQQSLLPGLIRFFGLGAVLIGTIIGSGAVAWAREDLTLDRFADRDDVKRHLIGGALMGFGGALMAGCTFGALSGFAVLSFTSFIAIAAMIAGCVWGIRTLEAGSAWGGLRLCFGRKAS